MIKIAIIEESTGRITSTVVCHVNQVAAQYSDGYFPVPAADDISDTSHYYKDGRFVSYPPKPIGWSTFDFVTEQWVDQRSFLEIGAQLEVTRAASLLRVNAAIEKIRARYITVIAGQDMIYVVKREEAAAYVNDPAPNLADYPLIAEEIGVTAPTAYEVAQVWLYMNAALKPIAGRLERIRLTATNDIKAASTEADIIAADAAFTASLAAANV